MDTPLFSIIIPVFNRAAELEKTLASVLSQQPGQCECLVIDGGSTDGTVAVLQAQGERVRWISEPDQGVYDAMNKALGLAAGEFFYFLGAGDTLRPGILNAVAAIIPRRPDTFFYGSVLSEFHGRIYNGRYSRWKLSRVNICHQAIFAHRNLFGPDRAGPFDVRYPITADYIWNMKCFGDARVRKVYADLVIADYAAGGLSAVRPDPQLLAERLTLIRRHLGFVPYVLNRAAAAVPSWLKETRYQAFQRLRVALPRRRR